VQRKDIFRVIVATGGFFAYVLGFAIFYYFAIPDHFRYEGVGNDSSYHSARVGLVEATEDLLLRSKENERLFDVYAPNWLKEKAKNTIADAGTYALFSLAVSKDQESSERNKLSLDLRYIMSDDGTFSVLSMANSGKYGDLRGFKKGLVSFDCPSPHWCTATLHFPDGNDVARVFGDRDSELIYGFLNAKTQLQEGLAVRLFYFSAVTATTLGYGDIVPVTSVSRLAVAFESIFGLVVMGALVVYVTGGGRGR